MADPKSKPAPKDATGVLVLASGQIIWGRGFGAQGSAVGEVCFNTAMTGYQEVMTDPSYAGQIINFTFPHIGNVGTNDEDFEAAVPHALGCIVREDVTAPSNFRNTQGFNEWMAAHGRIGLAGVDTRALTRMIRIEGAPNAVIAHNEAGEFDLEVLLALAQDWNGLEGADLASDVTAEGEYGWDKGLWRLPSGISSMLDANGEDSAVPPSPLVSSPDETPLGKKPKVVAIDYGIKSNILNHLVEAGADVTVVPGTASFEEIMKHKPDGLFLSNGPGDPSATAEYAVPVIKAWLETGKPLFGICLGHQMLGLALGAQTGKMFQGHRGANHPVKRMRDGAVEITSMNHGFAVDTLSLPEDVKVTHVSLFDGSLCGLETTNGRAFSVQYHPEASPGPQDSQYLFTKFVGMMG